MGAWPHSALDSQARGRAGPRGSENWREGEGGDVWEALFPKGVGEVASSVHQTPLAGQLGTGAPCL